MNSAVITFTHTQNEQARAACFTAKQAERLRALLEVAEQSTDNERDADLLDRLSRLFA